MNAILSSGIQSQLDAISSTRGAIIYRGASNWVALTPGTSTYVLTSNGTGADPTWQAASGGLAPGTVVTQNSGVTPALTLRQDGVSETLVIQRGNGGAQGDLLTFQDVSGGGATTVASVTRGGDISGGMISAFAGASVGYIFQNEGSTGMFSPGYNSKIIGLRIYDNEVVRWGAYGMEMSDTTSIGTPASGKTRMTNIGGEVNVCNSSSVVAPLTGPGSVLPSTFTVSTLPSASTFSHSRAIVTDALAPAFGSTVVGSGSVIICVFSNGTNWIVG